MTLEYQIHCCAVKSRSCAPQGQLHVSGFSQRATPGDRDLDVYDITTSFEKRFLFMVTKSRNTTTVPWCFCIFKNSLLLKRKCELAFIVTSGFVSSSWCSFPAAAFCNSFYFYPTFPHSPPLRAPSSQFLPSHTGLFLASCLYPYLISPG